MGLNIVEGVGLRARFWGLIWPSLDHRWITHSRKRTVPRGHGGTRSPHRLSSGGPQRSRQDTRGHGADTVRDREAEGSKPSPPTKIRIQIRLAVGANVTTPMYYCSSSAVVFEGGCPDAVAPRARCERGWVAPVDCRRAF